MKDLEKSFFTFCCRQLDHRNNSCKYLVFRPREYDKKHNILIDKPLWFDDMIELYIEKHIFSHDLPKTRKQAKKILNSYISKWDRLGFIDRLGGQYAGCAVFRFYDDVHGKMILPLRYAKLVPLRIIRKMKIYYIPSILIKKVNMKYIEVFEK